jgi:hypothetical protein
MGIHQNTTGRSGGGSPANGGSFTNPVISNIVIIIEDFTRKRFSMVKDRLNPLNDYLFFKVMGEDDLV